MPSLVLKRDRFYFGVLRRLKIKINGEAVVYLKHAEEKVIELNEGNYTLVAQMDWTKSAPLSVSLSGDERVCVQVGLISYIWLIIMIYVPPFVIFTLKEISRESSR